MFAWLALSNSELWLGNEAIVSMLSDESAMDLRVIK